MRDIKFELVAKNMKGEILNEVYTLEELMGFEESYFVDIIAKRQFTGLHDCNGKEICEGDVVKALEASERGDGHYDDILCIIQWREEDACFEMREIGFKDWYFLSDFDIEVVGNRFESPELMEE